MAKKDILLIGLGVLIAVSVLILVIVTVNTKKSTIQENTTEIFSDAKIQKIETTLENNSKQKFQAQEF